VPVGTGYAIWRTDEARPVLAEREVDLMMAIFGALLPRFVLLVAWSNDQSYWSGVFGSPAWFVSGFVVFPWTTLVYGLSQANGMTLLNWIFVGAALLIDLGTWGIGVFAGRKQAESYMGT
jgi:hypothetical protein